MVIEGETEVGDGTNGDDIAGIREERVAPTNDDRRFVDLAYAQDPGLRLIDDGRSEKTAPRAMIGQRKSPARQFIRSKLPCTGALGEIVERAGQAQQVERVSVFDDGDHQAIGDGSGHAHMDGPFQHDAVIRPGAVGERMLFEGADNGSDEIGREGEIGPVLSERILLSVTMSDHSRQIADEHGGDMR